MSPAQCKFHVKNNLHNDKRNLAYAAIFGSNTHFFTKGCFTHSLQRAGLAISFC